MKTKRLLLGVSITAVVLALILISLRAYYVAIALVVGTLIIGYRELWSLLRSRKLPVIDERVRENTSKSLRNGFIFFAAASAFLMLPFTVILTRDVSTVHVLGGLFLSGGTVYLLSYIFYDRVEPKLSERGLKVFKAFLLIAGISLGVFIISVVLHNALGGLLGVEEPVFFSLALISACIALPVGIVGSLVMFFVGLLRRS